MRPRAHGVRAIAALTALGCAALLAGCAPGHPDPRTSYTQVPTQAHTAPALSSLVNPAAPMGGGSDDAVAVTVFPVAALQASAGCGCSLEKGGSELFPQGTYVLVLKAEFTSAVNAGRFDAKGMTFDGSKFAGRPDLAVLDTADGPKAAKKAGLPWLPVGAYAGQTRWLLPVANGDSTASVAAAYFVPAGERELDLKVNVPGHGPLIVQAQVPFPLQQAASDPYSAGAGE